MWKDKLPPGSNQVDAGKKNEGKKDFFFGNFFLEKKNARMGTKIKLLLMIKL